MQLLKLIIAVGALLPLGVSARAQSLDVILNPPPQAYGNTCQSYALSFAMAQAGVPGYRFDTVQGIRSLEAQVRGAIEAEAKKQGGTPYDQNVWKAAVKMLTSDRFALNQRFFDDIEALMTFIGTQTGITNAGTIGSVLTAALVKTPVMTSFTKIGSDSYATGHIVTVLGTDGQPYQARRLMLFNSAVKLGGSGGQAVTYAPLCSTTQMPGDLKYRGAVGLQAVYTPKTYGGKYVALWISKK